MTVTFYNGFSKKLNSTRQPGNGSNYDCQLKDDCSIIHPRISLGGNFNPAGMMYCRIPSFNRYYFVSDWEWIGGAWVASLIVDPMATFKTQIGASSAYITRADTGFFNETISDGMFPATTEFSVVTTRASTGVWSNTLATGTFIIGIISSAPDTAGSITYYTMTQAQFSALKDFLFDDDFFQDNLGFPDVSSPDELLTSISPELLKVLFNPYQYIVSAIWVPLGVEGATENIKIGWWDTTVSGGRLSAGAVKINLMPLSIQLPPHPQAATRGSYLNYSPYSQHTLYFPPFGAFPIDPSYFNLHEQSIGTINIETTVDILTGKAVCVVKAGTNKIGELTGQVGVPIQIAQVASDMLGAGISAVNGIGNAVSGGISGFRSGGVPGAIVGAIGKGAEALYNTIQTAMPQIATSGLNGSFAGLTDTTASLVSKYFRIADPDDEHRGRPVCQIGTIGEYSGFVQCAEGDISISGTAEERNTISSYMVSGFFYE